MSTPDAEIVSDEPRAVALRDTASDLVPQMVSDIESAKARLKELQRFVKEVMVEGDDYGTIPGVTKPVLLKPGAEKLCEIYGYAQDIKVVNRVERWEAPQFFHYEVRCDLVSKRTGHVVGAGVGSCNSLEGRYRWREANRKCPKCSQESIIKGKEEFGGGWLCFKKKGGCGAKFGDSDTAITNQQAGKVENDDVPTLVNTILKMAKKRAVVDATLSVTRSSALFTQDVEDTAPADAKAADTSQHPLTDEQYADLMSELDILDIPMAERTRLCDHIGVKNLSDLTQKDAGRVKKWLEKKKAEKKGEKAA